MILAAETLDDDGSTEHTAQVAVVLGETEAWGRPSHRRHGDLRRPRRHTVLHRLSDAATEESVTRGRGGARRRSPRRTREVL